MNARAGASDNLSPDGGPPASSLASTKAKVGRLVGSVGTGCASPL